jgi:pilus assembly protein CpaF
MSPKARAGGTGLFVVIDTAGDGRASEMVRRTASGISSKGLNALVMEMGEGSTARGIRTASEVERHIEAMDGDALRGYLGMGSARLGGIVLDGRLHDEGLLNALMSAYDIAIVVMGDLDRVACLDGLSRAFGRQAAMLPCLCAVSAGDATAVRRAGALIRNIVEREDLPRPVAFSIQPHELELASRLSRKWKLPAWGDSGSGANLSERILSRAIRIQPLDGRREADGISQAPAPEGMSPHVRRILKELREDEGYKSAERELRKGAMSHDLKRKVARIARRMVENLSGEPVGADEIEGIISKVVDEACGLGPIERYIADPDVTEIMACGSQGIYVERGGRIARAEERFENDEHIMAVIDRILLPAGRRVDERYPFADARLPDGSRVHAIIPPIAIDGPQLTIRRFSSAISSLHEAIENGTLPREAALFLSACVTSRISMVISGGTGSGKTTLLNILAREMGEGERIVTIEDAAELNLPLPHVVRLEARPPTAEGEGEITIRELVRNALRMRPDRIVVGECRGGEALDMLQAMNTGHEGSLTTIHANSPRDALSRLETMVLMAGVELPLRAVREQIWRGVDLVVQISRMGDGSRRVTGIAEVAGMEGDTICLQGIAERDERGVLAMTGLAPTFQERLDR